MNNTSHKIMKQTTIISFTSLILISAAYIYFHINIFLTLAITSGTIFFHFAVRLLIGLCIDSYLHNHIDYKQRWFMPFNFEEQLYKAIRVKKWKKLMPTYTPETFSLKKHSMAEIASATCQSEIVHELNIIASFIPLLFSIWAGSFWVFFITSVIGALYDLIFVIIQRFNRPRLIKIIERK